MRWVRQAARQPNNVDVAAYIGELTFPAVRTGLGDRGDDAAWSAGANPAWTALGRRWTARSSHRAAAGLYHQSNPPSGHPGRYALTPHSPPGRAPRPYSHIPAPHAVGQSTRCGLGSAAPGRHGPGNAGRIREAAVVCPVPGARGDVAGNDAGRSPRPNADGAQGVLGLGPMIANATAGARPAWSGRGPGQVITGNRRR